MFLAGFVVVELLLLLLSVLLLQPMVLRIKHKALYPLGKYPTELNIHPSCLIKNKDSLIVLIKLMLD